MAQVKLYGSLRRLATQPRAVVHGATVREVLDALTRDNVQLRVVLTRDSAPAEHIRITRNGHDIRHLQNLETPLTEEDEVAIFSPVAGG